MNLTPEQMNEAVEAVAQTETFRGGPCMCGECREAREDARHTIERLLPVLFAAWQEQTAAKAGENPTREQAADAVGAISFAVGLERLRCEKEDGEVGQARSAKLLAAMDTLRAYTSVEGAAAGHPVGLRTPSHHKTDPPRYGAEFKTNTKPIVIPDQIITSNFPTDEQWETIVTRSKTRKRSIKALAERSGWKLIGEDPKEQRSWSVAA